MLLTVKELISVLRSSVNVQIPVETPVEGEEDVTTVTSTIDPAYLVMTDDDIELFIKLGVSRAYPEVSSLDDLPEGSEYPITLLAKIELYTKLAVTNANKVDMGADNNNYLKQDQRFQHYMSLVKEAREQYDDWLENEGQGEVKTFDVLLSNRHYTSRNYEKQSTPKVLIKVDQVTADTIEFRWLVSNTSHFGRFKVYASKAPIVNMHNTGNTYASKISVDAKLVLSTSDIRNTFHRLEKLESNTEYHIAVVSIERNQVFGVSEIIVSTLEELQDEEEVVETTI